MAPRNKVYLNSDYHPDTLSLRWFRMWDQPDVDCVRAFCALIPERYRSVLDKAQTVRAIDFGYGDSFTYLGLSREYMKGSQWLHLEDSPHSPISHKGRPVDWKLPDRDC